MCEKVTVLWQNTTVKQFWENGKNFQNCHVERPLWEDDMWTKLVRGGQGKAILWKSFPGQGADRTKVPRPEQPILFREQNSQWEGRTGREEGVGGERASGARPQEDFGFSSEQNWGPLETTLSPCSNSLF